MHKVNIFLSEQTHSIRKKAILLQIKAFTATKYCVIKNYLQSKGIGTGIHYPVANHQQPAITKMYSDLPKLPKTEAVLKEILSLPIYGELPLDDVDYVCDSILEFFGK